MRKLYQYIVDSIRRPREELSRRQHQLRYAWDITIHCWRQLIRHRAEGMAAELTYRTIFSLIPLVVLGLVMFRIVGGLDDVQQKVEDSLYSFFGVPEIPQVYTSPESEDAIEGAVLTPMDGDLPSDLTSTDPMLDERETSMADESSRSEGAAEEAKSRAVARAGIRRALHEATTKVASLDFASIGVVGLLLFIYAAIALADSAESIFNLIFEASTTRPLHLRVAIHWSIITLGSGLLAVSLYMSGQAVEWFASIGVGSDARVLLSHLLSVVASWVLLFLLYALMPNTNVSVRAAAIGALVGAVLWEAAKFGFQIYVLRALPYSALYGSLGLIPLFLFWVYITWWIFLFGSILTHTLQSLRGRRPQTQNWNERGRLQGDPDWMLPIMVEVSDAFKRGKSIDIQELADQLGLSSSVVHEMGDKLIEAGLLRRVSMGVGQNDALTLARPAERITIQEVLKLAHQSRPTNNHPAWQALADLKKAERDSAGDKTLATIELGNATS
ncbi:ribonuclease BN/unknown domain fusion protein [Novipirellula aureliae]|uniref:Uncharacterized protein n=1 Tax=Novipirellula aureliae TaxID=2527966 RepID=A0A5C6E1Y8_9BACT|nr:YihY/virulence factor BrkB family protein [Novipirellula aureliae]TWU41159.1 ribonuclease BN/unknown domain fusion protein [Novipirellula aureliae]